MLVEMATQFNLPINNAQDLSAGRVLIKEKLVSGSYGWSSQLFQPRQL